MIIHFIKGVDVSEVGSDALQAILNDEGFDAKQTKTAVTVHATQDDLLSISEVIDEYNQND